MIQFGEFTLDSKQARLFCKNVELSIEPKQFELLLLFVNQPNTIISRQDILDTLWAGSLVTDNAINKMVANLRKILADGAKNPHYIQTVPKRGYRFICEVTSLEISASAKQLPFTNNRKNDTNSNKRNRFNNPKNKVIVALFLAFCSLFIWQVLSHKDIESSNSHYSIALTRAHGVEQSARMHPDNKHLFYLKKDVKNTTNQLWIKNIHTKKIVQVDTGKAHISKIIAVVSEQNNEQTNMFYLDKTQKSCGVYQVEINQSSHEQRTNKSINAEPWQQAIKLFDCSDKRIKDIDYHASRNVIYYTAQPQNFWPNQIYAFNLASQNHTFVTQVEPEGWGHHSIDISPDGNKLLIMSTKSDYKTQLLVLNLLTNELSEGFKFDYPVTEAIWHHDSEQVYYYTTPPAQQIVKSDINGNNISTVVNVSENLSPQMSLFPDNKNLLFSTEHKNLSNRWLVPSQKVTNIDNSTADDINPVLFHHSEQYFFISERSGRRQIYLGRSGVKQAEMVTNFSQAHWLDYMAISANDQNLLLNVGNEVYLLPINNLNEMTPLTKLKQEHLIFASDHPIIALDWLTEKAVAITTVKNGIPELMLINLSGNKVIKLNGQWAYGLSDEKHPEYNYFIEQKSNILYRVNSLSFKDDLTTRQRPFTKTQITLPNGFYHVKIDANILYYGSDENDSIYLNAVPINANDKESRYLLNYFSGYDTSNGKIILSDIESLEGDVHRTMH